MFCILTWSSMLVIQLSSVPALQAIKACTVSMQKEKQTGKVYVDLFS